ncbi:MAG TPA: hypothetical protein VNJ01_11450 [Bacteriovoracaceae bacterium]|nr:hypothetical protein [Bacteriovoracaceae bacterium]
MKYILLFSMVLTSQTLKQDSARAAGLSGKVKSKSTLAVKRANRKSKSRYWRVCAADLSSAEIQS